MKVERKAYDVVVIGSGGAGTAAASCAAANSCSVLLVSKDPIVCSDSKISEGIVTVRGSGGISDTEDELSTNIRTMGDDLVDPELANAFAADSVSAYEWLQCKGLKCPHDKLTGQPKTLGLPMGGHSKSRSVPHTNGGLDYGHALWNTLNNSENIEYLEDAWFLDLYLSPDNKSRVIGGLIYHGANGSFISVKASAVIIASGGLGTLYFPHTDTMRGNTGDGYALAARAGAQLVDMEQIQFIPFAVAPKSSYEGLVLGEPVSAGPLGVIRDKNGKKLLGEVMVRTRAHCASVIAHAVASGRGTNNGGCYLDLTANMKGEAGPLFLQLMKKKAGSFLQLVKKVQGKSAAQMREPWEGKPSAHYCMGGIRATANGEVIVNDDEILQGLFVAGQAMGGVHGSNRLGSTSLAEALIFGRRAGVAASKFCHLIPRGNWISIISQESILISEYLQLQHQKGDKHAVNITKRIQSACWQGIGPARVKEGIERVFIEVDELSTELERVFIADTDGWNQTFIDYIECKNLLLCAQMVASSALTRSESLGAHVRLDDPDRRVKVDSPYSIVCFQNDAKTIETKLLNREASSWKIRWKVHANQLMRLMIFKLINRMPNQWIDNWLKKFYQKQLMSNKEMSSVKL